MHPEIVSLYKYFLIFRRKKFLTCTHISTKKVNFQFEFLKNKNISEILNKISFGTVKADFNISDRKCAIFTSIHETFYIFRKNVAVFGPFQRLNLVKAKTKMIDVFAASSLIYMWSLKKIGAYLLEILTKTSRKSVIFSSKIVTTFHVLVRRFRNSTSTKLKSFATPPWWCVSTRWKLQLSISTRLWVIFFSGG